MMPAADAAPEREDHPRRSSRARVGLGARIEDARLILVRTSVPPYLFFPLFRGASSGQRLRPHGVHKNGRFPPQLSDYQPNADARPWPDRHRGEWPSTKWGRKIRRHGVSPSQIAMVLHHEAPTGAGMVKLHCPPPLCHLQDR
jgi:hypothetical protein